MMNPLLDKDFLLELDRRRDRETYVRLTALTLDEHPIESIEGKATQGSINIDGMSAVRRTCNLTMVVKSLDINYLYWTLQSKFKLEIGIKNNINEIYDDIIWFPFGIYVINNFSTSQGISNLTVNISGKDKMCLLNGEIGGHFNSSTVLDTITYTNEQKKTVTVKYPVQQIIKEMVHQFGNESFSNIIINDIADYGVILQEYRGDKPLYLFKDIYTDEIHNMTFNEDMEIQFGEKTLTIAELDDTFKFDLFNTFTDNNYQPDIIKISDKEYTLTKVEYGQTPGYTLTDLTYPSELVAAVGETVTTILDKIVQMLGNFEYFYDIDGRFIFQKRPAYTSTNESVVDGDGTMFYENAALTSAVTYSFDNSSLIQSISNNPNIMNVKNDFSVWGVRRSTTGKELPVHMRYAIDKKPISYTQFPVTQEEVDLYNKIYNENMKPRTECKTFSVEEYDWREIIYQMAKDFRNYNHLDGFEAKLALANPDLYPTGKTGYEQYYIDMEGFWRQLYNPNFGPEYATVTYNALAPLDRYVTTYSRITDQDTEYEKYFVIRNNKLIKYIDLENVLDYYLKSEAVTENGKDEYTALMNTLNLEKYIIYIKENDEYIPLSTGKEDDLYIQNGVNRYIKVRDFFNVLNVEGSEKETFYIFNDDTSEQQIITFVRGDKETPVENVDDVRKYWDELYYKVSDENYISLKSKNTLNIYVIRDRDIKNKTLYIQNDKGEYISFNNNQSAEDKQSFYIIKNETEEKDKDGVIQKKTEFMSIIDLLKPDREKLYQKIDNDYKSLVDVIREKELQETLYKENFEKINENDSDKIDLIYVEANKIEDSTLRSLYINEKNEYNKYLYFEAYNCKGMPSEYFNDTKEKIQYYEKYYEYNNKDDSMPYWHVDVLNQPEALNFWIDFLDFEGELDHFSIPVIGDRSKPINDSNVKAIYFRDTPTILFVDDMSSIDKKSGYSYLQLQPGMKNLFFESSQGKSAKNVIEEALYNHAYCADAISLTTIPIYYLQPNTRIFVRDDNTFINGEYIINKISFSLAFNGMSTISANKAIEQILY